MQFALVAALFTLMPGADWAYAIAAGLRSRSIVPPVLGLASGYVLMVGVLAVGLGALVASRPGTLTILTVAGSLYIIYLGATTLLSLRSGSGTLVAAGDAPGEGSTRTDPRNDDLHQYLRGLGVSGVNPKGMLLLLALLPQFLTPEGWSSPLQISVLGAIFIMETLVVYLGVAALARALLHSRPRLSLAVSAVSGVFLISFGLWLLVEELM